MKSYIVGGYVRDKLLGLEPKDRDWVVVGSTVDEMLNQGYQLIGKEFPVFLHPKTKEIYALARTERTTSQQIKDRRIFADPNVSLEDDLEKRDLTINAMAMTKNGELIDPFNGARDLKAKVLRHVSPSFREDPVRVLRTARLAARYGFFIADETHSLIQTMLEEDDLDELVPERIWSELQKTLEEAHPDIFITKLREMGVLAKIFPEIDRLFGVPQTEKYHPEIDTGVHMLMTLKKAVALSPDPVVRFGALVHDLGKGITKASMLPRHIGHEKKGVRLVEQLCNRLRAPNRYQQFGKICAEYHLHVHRAFELTPKTFVKMFTNIGAFKRPGDLDQFLLVCQADAQGRKGLDDSPYPQAEYVKAIFDEAAAISTEEIAKTGLKGEAFGDELHQRRMYGISQKIVQIQKIKEIE